MSGAESTLPYPADDDLETEVLQLPRRRRLPLLTLLLAFAAVAAGAFVGGVETQKHLGAPAASASAGGSAAGRGAGLGFARRFSRGGGGGLFGGAGGGTFGLVTVVDGSTLYVTDFSGNTVKVKTPPGLRVSRSLTTSVRSIRPGEAVVVRGTQMKGGAVKASAITIENGSSG